MIFIVARRVFKSFFWLFLFAIKTPQEESRAFFFNCFCILSGSYCDIVKKKKGGRQQWRTAKKKRISV